MTCQMIWLFIVFCCIIVQPVQGTKCQSRCGLLRSSYYTGTKGTNNCKERCLLSIFGHIILGRVPTGYQCGTCKNEPIIVDEPIDLCSTDLCSATDSTSPKSTYDIRMKLVIDPQDLNVFKKARSRWSQIINSDLRDQVPPVIKQRLPCGTYPKRIDDLYICASYQKIDSSGGLWAYARTLYERRSNGFSYVGELVFDLDDMDYIRGKNRLYDLIVHEMGHIIGVSRNTFENKNLVTTTGDRCDYIGVNANREYKKITNCNAVPMKLDGDDFFSKCQHWDDFCLGNEIMTGFLSGDTQPISTITIGALNDIGYNVNYNNADPYGRNDMHGTCFCNRRLTNINDDDDNDDNDISYINEYSKQNNNYLNITSQGEQHLRKNGSAIHIIDSLNNQEVINDSPQKYDELKNHHTSNKNTATTTTANNANNNNLPKNNNRHRHRLSESGYQRAIEAGRKVLKENSMIEILSENNVNRNNGRISYDDDNYRYVGDQGVTVYYFENDIVYDVHVTPE